MNKKKDFHINQIAKFEAQIASSKKQLKKIFIIRSLTSIFTVLLLIYVGVDDSKIIFFIISIAILTFLILMRKESKLNNKIIFNENHKEINAHEIKLLNYDFENIKDGVHFHQDYHEYSRDLDIFGYKSIYQLLNRTCTYSGSQILGNTLNYPSLDIDDIYSRQDAIKELSSKEEWCHDFLAYGKGTSEKDTIETIVNWLNGNNIFNLQLINIIIFGFPFICLIFGFLGILGVLNFGFFWIVFILQLLLTLVFNAKINDIHNKLSKKYSLIDKYLNLIKLIEQQSFKTTLLQKLHNDFIINTEKNKATQVLGKLKKYLDLLDGRLNVIMAIVLNGIFLWDLNTVVKIEKWKINNKEKFTQWMDAISELDALISIALFAKSNSEYVYPEILEGNFKLSGKDMGHPLVNKLKLVKNDYQFEENSKVDLLTGANMAGKSTFLRTIGVNIVLARIGAPVCAKKFSLTPINLFTSLRTIDSLQENESFFYAELKRLETLIKLYKSNNKIFFLLDEILKGTNSKDQHYGSVGLIKKILALDGSGIIATHDLALSSLQDEYPKNIRNICFEIEIENNELKFDYKLKLGFCKTMNASFLMKNMDII